MTSLRTGVGSGPVTRTYRMGLRVLVGTAAACIAFVVLMQAQCMLPLLPKMVVSRNPISGVPSLQHLGQLVNHPPSTLAKRHLGPATLGQGHVS